MSWRGGAVYKAEERLKNRRNSGTAARDLIQYNYEGNSWSDSRCSRYTKVYMAMGVFLIGRPIKPFSGLLFFVVYIWLACSAISPAIAGERELPTQQRSSVDVVLVFDASGSMLKTDPDNLRYEGAKLLLSFLGEGDRIAVVGFAGVAKVVRDLEPFSQSVSAQVANQIEAIRPDGSFSDIAEAIKLGKSILDDRPRPEAQRVMVLLSDGKMEPNPAVSQSFARTLELVHDVLPELKSKEIKVFTLAFSAQADRPFLSEIAAATDGLTWYTATSQEIHKSFADLFLAIKRPQVVSQTGRGFKIDDDVEEATFYINHDPGAVLTLESPRGDLFSVARPMEYITWFSAKNFDVITVKEPDQGQWRVLGTNAVDGFATVLTDLKLLTDWPLVIRAGDEPLVQARFYEGDKPVALPEMSGVVTYAFQITPTDRISQPIAQKEMRDDGSSSDKVALDGIFSATAEIERAGEYKLTVVAKGPTFQRSQQIPFTVRPRLVHLKVLADDANNNEAELDEVSNTQESGEGKPHEHSVANILGDERAEFLVKVSKETSSFKSFDVSLIAVSEDREKTELEMKRTRGLEFSISAAKLPAAGSYTIKAVLRGESKKEQEVEGESESFHFVYSPRKIKEEIIPTPEATTAERGLDQEKHAGEEKFPIVPLGVISAVNMMALTCVFVFLRRRKKKSAPLPPRYLPHKQLIDAISSLEERTSSTKVELTDPIFTRLETQRATATEGLSEAVVAPKADPSEVAS